MSHDNDYELIDRHLAGILRPEEEARLEALIRTSPEWARRYRDAEELARLVGEAVGRGPAPERAKRSIRAAIEATDAERRLAHVRRPFLERRWLVAACLLVAVAGAYLFGAAFLPGTDDGAYPLVYANEPLPLKDLARQASIGVVGTVVQENGMLGLSAEQVLFGDADGVSFALPTELRPGQRVALFGVRREGRAGLDGDDRMVEVVGGPRGVVHLDGLQRWDGRSCSPEECAALVTRASKFRSLAASLDDLSAFLDADASLTNQRDEDGLPYSGAVTATFLGRFQIRPIRADLLRLVADMDKDPVARKAAAGALVASDPAGSCREILRRVLAGRPHLLRAEAEDGNVILECLELMERHGTADLAPGLQKLAGLVDCPAIRHAAGATARAVGGAGPRGDVEFMRGVEPVRLKRDGREALVMSGCEGRQDGLLVVFRHDQSIDGLRLPVNVAVGRGMGVIVLPPGVEHVEGWIRAAVRTGHVSARSVRYLGIGKAALDALAAANRRPPEVVYLLAEDTAALPRTPSKPVKTDVYGADLTLPAQEGAWSLHPTAGTPKTWLADEGLWVKVLATD